jgi:hypothetical protein
MQVAQIGVVEPKENKLLGLTYKIVSFNLKQKFFL